MKSLVATLAAVLMLAIGQPVLAGDKGSTPSKPKAHTTQRHKQPRVYGTPIQPPIVKARGKRNHAHKSAKADTPAQKKARANATRKRRANEEYRRQHPAAADGPR